MQVHAGLLRAAMAHQRSNDREVDATVHQVRGESVAQRPGGNAGSQSGAYCSSADDLTNVLGRDSAVLHASAKQRPALAMIEQVGQQLGVDRARDRDGAGPVILGLADDELLALAIDVADVQGTELAGAQAAA